MALSFGLLYADDICEGCWELGGRTGVLLPASDSGLRAAPGLGVFGAYRFRPYWAVEMGLDRHPGRIKDGPDETLTFLMVRGAYLFRAARETRTRPFIFGGLGLGFDQIGTEERTVQTPSGKVSARTNPDSDAGIAYVLGVGGLTSLRGKLWVRYEAQWITWSTFGLGQNGVRILGTFTWRFGR